MSCFKLGIHSISTDAFSTTNKDKKPFIKHLIAIGYNGNREQAWKRWRDFKKANK